MENTNSANVHATCVAFDNRGVLILGASGSGKSSLGLQMMGLGAHLVSDDRVIVQRAGAHLIASAPSAIAGLIEARGVGLIKADQVPHAPLVLAVDLDQIEEERLPNRNTVELLGVQLTLLKRVDTPGFAAAVLQCLRFGRKAP